MTTKSKSWRDVLPIHPAAELFPRMSEDELRALGQDILTNGLRAHLTIWKAQKHFAPELLDGRNRLDAMQAVGIAIEVENVGSDTDPAIRLWMRQSPKHVAMRIETIEIRGDRPAGDPYTYVVSANIRRRHLTAEQRRELIGKLIKAAPKKSDRQIAETVKASPTTVGTVRAEMEATGDVSKLDTRTDSKGRKQPSHKLRPPEYKRADIKAAAFAAATTKSPARPAPDRTDIGPDSHGETERLRARCEELQAEARLRQIKIVGLESEIAEQRENGELLDAWRRASGDDRRRFREFIAAEERTHAADAARPPSSDGLDIPALLRRAP
jgi:hypothetical protein